MIINDDAIIDFEDIKQYNCFIKNLIKNKFNIYIKGTSSAIFYIIKNNKINFLYINLKNKR